MGNVGDFDTSRELSEDTPTQVYIVFYRVDKFP
jgi:hypothetical protein